jgi:hypothetical protein
MGGRAAVPGITELTTVPPGGAYTVSGSMYGVPSPCTVST